MNRLVSRIAVAALLLLPAVSEADPLLSFGPDVPMFITVAASVRRENNVFLSSQDQQADTIYVLVPGINLQWTGGKSSLGIASVSYTHLLRLLRLRSFAALQLDSLRYVLTRYGVDTPT